MLTIDYSDSHIFNWVFRKVDRVGWQAELIDWENFTEESGYENYTNPPEPFEIDPKCVFVPRPMKKLVASES